MTSSMTSSMSETTTTTTTTMVVVDELKPSGSGLKRSSSWRKFKNTVKETVTGMVQKTVGGQEAANHQATALLLGGDDEDDDELLNSQRATHSLVIHSTVPIEVPSVTCPIADLERKADAAFAAAAKMTPPPPPPPSHKPAAAAAAFPDVVPQIIVTDFVAESATLPTPSAAVKEPGATALPQHMKQQSKQPTAIASSVPNEAIIPSPCSQAACSSSDPDLSHGGSDDQQQLQQARKLAAVMKIKNAIKTAEKLEPPAGAGSAQRRLSDATLDSPSQRRKSVDSPAGGKGGDGGGGSTSLHRSSSMKQQKTTSSGATSSGGNSKQKGMIWEHFEPVPGQQAGRCKACHMTIQCKYNTGQFIRHLQLAHMDIFRKHQARVQTEWTKSIVERNINKPSS